MLIARKLQVYTEKKCVKDEQLSKYKVSHAMFFYYYLTVSRCTDKQ